MRKDFIKTALTAFGFLMVWVIAMSLVGCDEAAFKKAHPVVTEAVEAAETVAEPLVDDALHLPSGTTKVVVDAATEVVDTSPPMPVD